MSLIKALLMGGILTFLVSGAISGGGSKGGFLNIHELAIAGHPLDWSWPLFIVSSAIAWGIMLMMR